MNHLYFGDNLDVLKQLYCPSSYDDLHNYKTENISPSMKTTLNMAKWATRVNKGQQRLFRK